MYRLSSIAFVNEDTHIYQAQICVQFQISKFSPYLLARKKYHKVKNVIRIM